ncbi:MAG TPA: alanine racemase, partial [Armatimonadetes bacterium]|nr:alanine racemase [Armatimonadota bacterium]
GDFWLSSYILMENAMRDPRGHYLETFCEVDLSAFGRNIERIRQWVAGREIILAVKANAYGHGVVPICREAVQHNVHRFGVATLVEGVELRDAGIDDEIIMLTPPTLEQVPSVVYHNLSPNIVNRQLAEALSAEAKRTNKTIGVHIEIDTGMGRTGIMWYDAIGEIYSISQLPDIRLEGVFSHFPAADSKSKSDVEFTQMQLRRFSDIITSLKRGGVSVPVVHMANSAGILAYPIIGEAVRPGILTYGLYPSDEVKKSIKVEPVMSLRTRVVQLRDFDSGCSIGYGRTFITQHRERVAVIRAGYGDGLRRALSNRGEVLIRGKRCSILGRVSMDTTVVSADREVQLNDEVVIIGSQGKDRITADDHARWTYTISYEILTGISERVRRVYVKNGEVIEVM